MAPGQPRRLSVGWWCIVAVLVGLIIWVNYYRPELIVLDLVILIVLAVRWARSPSDREK